MAVNRTVFSTILLLIAFVGFNSWIFISDTFWQVALIAMGLILGGVAMIIDPSVRALVNGRKDAGQANQERK